MKCRHTYITPIGYARDRLAHDPGICGACGLLIDIGTSRPMTPMQIERWADERAEKRIGEAKSFVFASEVAR